LYKSANLQKLVKSLGLRIFETRNYMKRQYTFRTKPYV